MYVSLQDIAARVEGYNGMLDLPLQQLSVKQSPPEKVGLFVIN